VLKITYIPILRKPLFAIIALAAALASQTVVYAQASSANSMESLLQQIAERLSRYEFDAAIALFDTIPAPDRDSANVRVLEASVLASAGKLSEAKTIVQAVSLRESNNTEALYVLAMIEGAEGRIRQQQEALEALVRIDPNHISGLVALGNVQLARRNLREAAGRFRAVITIEPANAEALLGMARLLRINQEWDDAEVFFNRLIELHPHMALAWNERARFMRVRGRLDNALRDINEAKRLAPSDYWIAIDGGTILLDMDRRDDALVEFNRAVTINPNEFLGYVYTAGLKDNSGDLDGAEHDYAAMLRLKPDYHYAREGLGLHKMRRENWTEARDILVEAFRQAPSEYHYALLAGISWIRSGDLAGARTFLNQAMPKLTRDSLEWHMLRLYYDMTVRNYVGETNLLRLVNEQEDPILKARMLFYMAVFYDIRGNTNAANRYFLMVHEMDKRAIPEWRLNSWILASRNLPQP